MGTQYEVSVTVKDVGGLSNDAIITVHIDDVNEAPIIHDQQRKIFENSPEDTFVGKKLVFEEPDFDQIHKFEILSGDAVDVWKISECDGQLYVRKASLDFETKKHYLLLIQVTDSGVTGEDLLFDRATVEIEIMDVNEKPELAGARFSIIENVAVGTLVGKPLEEGLKDVDNSDNNPGDATLQTHEFWISAGNDNGAFSIDVASGQLSLSKQSACVRDDDMERTSCSTIDFEKQSSYLLEISVRDSGLEGGVDRKVAVAFVNIYVEDVNEAPRFYKVVRYVKEQANRVPEQAFDRNVGPPLYGEDDDGDEMRFAITDAQAEDLNFPFAIDSETGQLRVVGNNVLDYETKSQYKFEVVASDFAEGRDPKSTRQIITVKVIDVNENPMFVGHAYTIQENHLGVVGELQASDVDKGQALYFTILEGNTHQAFTLSESGVLKVRKAKIIDFEREERRYFDLLVEVRDNGDGGLVNESRVTVHITNVNEPPYFPEEDSYTRQVAENSESGSTVGPEIPSSDEDAGDSRSFHIDASSGTGSSVFSLTCQSNVVSTSNACWAATAQLLVSQKASLNFEIQQSYTLSLVATDFGGLSASIKIVIAILDKNEPPVIENAIRSVGQNAQISDTVGEPLPASDPDLDVVDVLSFEIISGNNHNVFAIEVNTGQITINKGPSPDRVEDINEDGLRRGG